MALIKQKNTGKSSAKEKTIKKKTDTKKKKTKNVQNTEPQYYTSATGIPSYNYNVYYMTAKEKIGYFIAAFVVGAVVGYLFYSGIGTDEFGKPTMITHILNIVIPVMVGLIAGKMFLPIRTQQLLNNKKAALKLQFRDMLESINTSLGAGKNVTDSFISVYEDLKMQYEEDAEILKELEIILSGLAHNNTIEDLLYDLGKRSGIDDIDSFANVFRISYRKGGNTKDTIRNTHLILSEKMEIAEDIETVITGSKNELNIMTFMPIMLIAMMKFMSPDLAANFSSPSGVIATTIAIAMFVGAYFIGRVVMEIKV